MGQRTGITAKGDDLNRWRAAHAEVLRLGRTLQADAMVFRRYAGELTYLPQTGVAGPLGEDLPQVAARMSATLGAITTIAAHWDEEITRLRALDSSMPVHDIQRGHAAAREAARLLRAALEGFDRVVLHPETAPLDAPYGSGAPRRVHPGAQCTWVAERADGLAREVANVTLRKENLLLNTRHRAG